MRDWYTFFRYRMLKEIKYWFKKQWQKITTGFPHEDSWEFRSWCARESAKRLRHFRNHLNGHPGTLTMKEWEDILDEIIWCMENIDNDPDPIYPEDYKHGYTLGPPNEAGACEIIFNDKRSPDFTPVWEHVERVSNGMELFGKWYLNLWD